MISLLVLSFLCLNVVNSWLILDLELNQTNYAKQYENKLWWFDDAGEPLILTPYLEKGMIDEAKKASFVPPFVGNVQSYSGFFTVDKEYDSNMFFWFTPAEESPETAPVVLWLQGGPGGSSLYGLFVEHGPYMIGKDGKIQKRDLAWTKTMNVLYIDNPVGTGYSYSSSTDGYSTDEVSVGNHLYICMQQFFTLFPELRKNEFYITGESYAGKYIPALGYAIHTKNPTADKKINLKGMAMGNGLSDPMNQWDYGSYLYGINLIDKRQKEKFEEQQNVTLQLIANNDSLNAFINYNRILGKAGSLFYNTTGYTYVYNYLISDNVPFDERYVKFLDSTSSRKAIHVGNLNYQMISQDVYFALINDFSHSVAPWVAELANHYKMMMYNGELDIVVPYPLTVNYVSKLNWCGAQELATAERHQWKVDGQLAGYIKTSAPDHCNGSIRLVMVRNSGHTVPEDQPLWAYNLISEFTKVPK